MSVCSVAVHKLTLLGKEATKLASRLIEAKAARICPPGCNVQSGRMQINIVEFARLVAALLTEAGEESEPLSAPALASLLGVKQSRIRWDDGNRVQAFALEGRATKREAGSLAKALIALFQSAVLSVTARASAAQEADLEQQYAAAEHAEQQQQRPAGPEPIGECE